MKYIFNLNCSLKQFVSLDLKNIKIDNFLVIELYQKNNLEKNEIKDNFKNIEEFIKKDPDDFSKINNYHRYYYRVSYNYLNYKFNNDLIDPVKDKKIILMSPYFCYFIIEQRSLKNNKISIFKDFTKQELSKVILKDINVALKYAVNFADPEPLKELEELPEFSFYDSMNIELFELQVAYLKRNIYGYYNYKISDKEEVFERFIESPNRRKLFNDILNNGFLRDKRFRILPDSQSHNLMKYIIKNHSKSFGSFAEYYLYLTNRKDVDIEKIDDIIFYDKEAIKKWFMISKSPFKSNSYLKNRERIENLFIKDLSSLNDFMITLLTKAFSNDKKYDFLDRRFSDIIEEILKIKDEEKLYNFLHDFYGSIGSYLDEKFNFRNFRDREMKKYPKFIEHISQFEKTLNQYNNFVKKT